MVRPVRSLLRHVRRHATDRVFRLGVHLLETRPTRAFRQIRSVDLGRIGFGDNLMAWVGLDALLSSGVEPLAPDCVLYVPNELSELAAAIFASYGLKVEGVVHESRRDPVGPVFAPAPPETIRDWYRSFLGPDWRINFYEAIDTQKTLPHPGARPNARSRFRLGLSERLIFKQQGWQVATPDYIGYRLWRPIASRLGLTPVVYLAAIKRSLPSLRRRIRRYVEDGSAKRHPAPPIAVFPAGKSFQALPPEFCVRLREHFADAEHRFYIQADDPWIASYRAAGLDPVDLRSVDDLLWTIMSARRLLTTDSFSSHVAQLVRDDFVLALSRDLRENVVHPGAEPVVMANHPPCAPCVYIPRHLSEGCPAGFRHCLAFDDPGFADRLALAVMKS